jgi:hypothetical protein
MSPNRKLWIRRLIAAGLIPLLTALLAALDRRFVHFDVYESDRKADSLHALINAKLDSVDRTETHMQLNEILTRLTQIQCGQKVQEGCR